MPVWVDTALPDGAAVPSPDGRPGHRLGDRRRRRAATSSSARATPPAPSPAGLRRAGASSSSCRAGDRPAGRMSRRPPRRGLSEDDERLWSAVKKIGQAAPPRPARADRAPEKPSRRRQPPEAQAGAEARRAGRCPPTGRRCRSRGRAALAASLDRRTVSRLTRGADPDRRADRSARADPERGAPAAAPLPRGRPGRGRAGGAGDHRQGQARRTAATAPYERGVLRRAVPEWLQSAAFRRSSPASRRPAAAMAAPARSTSASAAARTSGPDQSTGACAVRLRLSLTSQP